MNTMLYEWLLDSLTMQRCPFAASLSHPLLVKIKLYLAYCIILCFYWHKNDWRLVI